MDIQVLVAEVSGEYAHFKAHETTRENLSYPFPPKTALMGMIAGILGINRNSYWRSDNRLKGIRLALQIINPIRHYFLKVNYQSTKTTLSLGKGARLLLHPDPALVEYQDLNHEEYIKKMGFPKARGQNMPIRLNLLHDVRYRVFIHTGDTDLLSEIEERLNEHKYVYPPYLGHANLLARWKFIGKFDLDPVSSPAECNSIVSFDSLETDKMDFSGIGNPILYNLPSSMKLINEDKEENISNLALEHVQSVFIADGDNSFYGYFRENSLYNIKIGEENINFSFLS